MFEETSLWRSFTDREKILNGRYIRDLIDRSGLWSQHWPHFISRVSNFLSILLKSDLLCSISLAYFKGCYSFFLLDFKNSVAALCEDAKMECSMGPSLLKLYCCYQCSTRTGLQVLSAPRACNDKNLSSSLDKHQFTLWAFLFTDVAFAEKKIKPHQKTPQSLAFQPVKSEEWEKI